MTAASEFDEVYWLEHIQHFTPERTGLEVDAEFDTKFDAVYCAFNALFSHADAAQEVFQAVAKALRPGGRFLLDTQNRERLVQTENTRSWRGGGELPWLLEESRFDLLMGTQHIFQRRIFSDGHTEERTLTRYHYTLTELTALSKAVGLVVTAVYGDWQLGPYTAPIPRTILVTRKELR